MNTKAILPATTMKRNLLASIAVAITLAALPSARAATDTWTGATGGDWNTAGNWSPAKPGTADTALFNTALGSVTNASANQTVGSISFDTNAGTASGAFTLGTVGGNSLTLGNAGTIQLLSTLSGTGKSISINSPIVLTPASTTTAGAYTFANNATDSTNTLNFGGTISASTTTNTETLTLGGTNTGANTISGVISNGSATTFAITKSGAGKWTLSNANTYTGLTTVSAGTLAYGANDTISTGAVTVNGAGATLAMGAFNDSVGAVTLTDGTITGTGTLTSTSGFTMNNAGTTSVSANLAGSVALTKSAAGTLTLTGANTYNGATTISAGTLDLGGSTATGSLASTVLNLGGGSLAYTRTGNTTQAFTTTNINAGGSSKITAVAGNTLTLGALTRAAGGGAVDIGNTGTITTSTANGAGGILGGWATFNNGTTWAVANGAGSAITGLADGSYTLTSAAGTTAGNYTNQNINVDNSAGALSGVITPYSLRFNSAGANTVTLASGTNTIGAGAILVTSNVGNNLSTITGGNLTGAASADLVINQTNTSNGLTIASAIVNNTATSLSKLGAGTLTLSGTNTYTGATTVGVGVLNIQNNAATGTTAGGVTVVSGAALQIENGITVGAEALALNGTGIASDGALRNISGANVWQGTVTLGSAARINSDAGSLTFNTAANSITGGQNLTLGGAGNGTVGGTITTGTGTLTKDGAGTWTLSGANTYTGLTTVSAGTLTLGGNSTATTGGFLVQNASTLNIQNGTYTMANPSTFSVGANTPGAVVNQTGGSVVFVSGNQLLLGTSAGSTGTYNLSGGSLTTASAASRGIILGVNGSSTQSFNLSGTGVLNVVAGSKLMIGRDAANGNSNSTFSQTGGTATIADLSMGGCTSSTLTLSLTGGNFTATAFSTLSSASAEVSTINIGGTAVVTLPNLPTARGASSTATINFDGGTLKNSATGTFITGLTNAFIKAGGATFDTSLNSTTISQNLLTHAVSTGGGLTKAGINTLTLNGTNTYTGNTTISGGTLALSTSGSIANSSTLIVGNAGSSGAVLDLSAKSSFNVVSGQTLKGIGTVNIGAGKTVTVDAGAHWAPGNSIGTNTVTGNLTLAGAADFELGTAGTSHGSPGSSDRTNVSGSLALGGTLNLIDNAGANGNGSAGAGSYQIFTQAGAATGSFTTVNNITGYHAKVDTTTSGSVFVDNYQIAAANTITTPVDIGKARVGGTFGTSAVSIQNTSASNGYAEGLNATQGAVTGGASLSGTNVSNLAGGSTSTTITLGLGNATMATSGSKTGTATIDLASNGTNSGYSNTSLTSQVISVSGIVYDYAQPVYTQTSGNGTFGGSGMSYTLDFGTGLALNTNYIATINLANNQISLFQDALGGNYTGGTATGYSTTATNFGGLTAVAPGAFNSFTITFNTSSSGTFNDTLTLAGLSQQSGLSDASLTSINIGLTGTAVPEPATWGLLAFSLTTVMVLRRRRKF